MLHAFYELRRGTLLSGSLHELLLEKRILQVDAKKASAGLVQLESHPYKPS